MENNMTRTIREIRISRADEQLDRAVTLFNAGFNSKASKQRCLEALNSSYNYTRELHFDDAVGSAPDTTQEERMDHFARLEVPFDLHHVRDHHAEPFAGRWERVQELRSLREQVKATDVVPPVKDDAPLKALEARVTESLEDFLKRRNAQFVRGCELHDIFGGLPVSVTAHYVTNQFGTTFIRRFYFMNGKLTPLLVILGVMDAKAREGEE